MDIRLSDIAERIFNIEQNLQFLRGFSKDCHKIMEDRIVDDAIMSNLYLLSDRVLRLSEMICKYKNAGYPDSYSGFIYRVGDIGVLDKEFAYRFGAIAKFRKFWLINMMR